MKPDGEILAVRRMTTRVVDWMLTHTKVDLYSKPHTELLVILADFTDELRKLRQQPAAPQQEGNNELSNFAR